MTVLSASRLTRRFGERIAVEDVSFDLRPGEIFGLLGPNGGGKTTTLRMLAGLIAPTSGDVSMNGEPVNRSTSPRLRTRIGFLTEAPGLWDDFSVRQNLLVYARLHELPSPPAAVDRAMALLGIADRAGDSAATLSKGLRQRVALARALLHDPQIVLLDESTSGLDPESAHSVRQLIQQLRQQERTVVLSTHNLDEVERMADRVAVLRRRLLAVDTPDALRRRFFGSRICITLGQPAEPFVPILAGGDAISVDGVNVTIDLSYTSLTTPDLVRRLVQAGADIHRVAPEEQTLEDIYLKLVRAERPS